MTTLQTFFGPPATSLIVGTPGTTQITATAAQAAIATTNWRSANNLTAVNTGAIAADTYFAALNVTGQGNLEALLWQYLVADASKTITLRVTIDGTVALLKAISGIDGANRVYAAIGAFDYTSGGVLQYASARFNKSLLIEIKASNAVPAAYLDVMYKYQLTA